MYEIDAQRVAFIQELKSLVRATISLSHHDAEGTESGLLFRSQQAFELINWLQSVKSLDLYHHSLQVCMPSFYFFLCLFFYTFCCFSLPKVLQAAMSILSSRWRFSLHFPIYISCYIISIKAPNMTVIGWFYNPFGFGIELFNHEKGLLLENFVCTWQN